MGLTTLASFNQIINGFNSIDNPPEIRIAADKLRGYFILKQD